MFAIATWLKMVHICLICIRQNHHHGIIQLKHCFHWILFSVCVCSWMCTFACACISYRTLAGDLIRWSGWAAGTSVSTLTVLMFYFVRCNFHTCICLYHLSNFSLPQQNSHHFSFPTSYVPFFISVFGSYSSCYCLVLFWDRLSLYSSG